jgi:hypothetical protein
MIRKYCTRTLKCNPVHGRVHVFVAPHDKRSLDADKLLLTATVFPSISRPCLDGYQVLLASCNVLFSDHVVREYACEPEVHALTTAKHMADVMGINMVVVENMYCDTYTNDVWYDLNYYKAHEATRVSVARALLTPGVASPDDARD